MTRTTSIFAIAVMLLASGCGNGGRELRAREVDCSISDPATSPYEFRNIANFTASDSGWYVYADPTPHPQGDVATQQAVTLDAPGRCNDTRVLRLEAHGYNFWGAGFADWTHETSKADGTGYDGISFWARSAPNTEKTFMLYVDDGRTIVLTRAKPDTAGLLSAASAEEDLNGDGLLGPGETASGTECRVPPIQTLCDPACYYGGVQPPAAAPCVPEPGECGNQFHTYVTTTDDWEFFRIPWSELVQWPCLNRLAGGLNPADIRKLEIKFRQGTNYEIWIDNIAFYRLRADAGS